jgi:hypothetical protein
MGAGASTLTRVPPLALVAGPAHRAGTAERSALIAALPGPETTEKGRQAPSTPTQKRYTKPNYCGKR